MRGLLKCHAMSTLPIILDTDIGDDIDDALALAVILNCPEIELIGITTVFRNAPRRAVLAEHILQAWNRGEVPVCAGVSKPLLQAFEPQLGSQFEVLGDEVLDQPTEHAVDFLIAETGAEEEEPPENPITILAIGPLTNIALAIAKEPRLVSCAKLVLMGGMWNSEAPGFRADWNVASDPEAAAMVFNSGIEITMIGLDVTARCVLEESHLAQIKANQSPQGGVLRQLLNVWTRDAKRAPVLNDPLAVLSLFDDCVTFEDKNIEVVLCGKERGQTRVLPGKPNARVAVDVDVPRVLELFMERILAL